MTTANVAARALVHAYLSGRSMDEFMLEAVVWMAERRLTRGLTPVLDPMLRYDIDQQASAASTGRPRWAMESAACRPVAGISHWLNRA